jgi:hypothetical protein
MSDEFHDGARDEVWLHDLQRRAAPLRVELPPWGEVLARDAWREPSTTPAQPRRWRLPVAVAVAFAAGALLTLAWRSPEAPTVTAPEAPLPVAAPSVPATPKVPGPAPSVVPMPAVAPIVPPPETAASAVVPAVAPSVKPVPRVRPRPRAKPPSTPAIELPERLSAGQIKLSLVPILPRVRACAAESGVEGVRVQVKLTISGELGRVTSALVMSQQELPDGFGSCVEQAVKRAEFPRFRKSPLGVVYPFEL